MKKILLAFDGTQFSEGAFGFARQLNTLQPVLLTGIFLPQTTVSSLWSYANGMEGAQFIPLLEKDDTEIIQKNIERFERQCRENNIACKVHRDFFDFALPELKKETRFADLLIIGVEAFYKGFLDGDAQDYLEEALHASECPVLLVPEKFVFPQRNILAYDGSGSSVYAIRQFAWLFPELCRCQTLLVHLGKEEEQVPDRERIKELVHQHFSPVTVLKVDVHFKEQFVSWLSGNSNAVLVCGSFGRSAFSEWFRKSFVSDLVAEHRLPIFIAHR